MTDTRRTAVPPRAYAAVVMVVLVAMAAVLVHWLLPRKPRFAGTNSVAPVSLVFLVPSGQDFCLRDLLVPAGADRVLLDLVPAAGSTPRVSLSLRTPARYAGRASRVLASPADAEFALPRNPRTSSGILCAKVTGNVSVAGYPQLKADGRPQAFVSHRPQLGGRASVWFIDSRKRSLLSLLPAAARRASVFRAGIVGPWTYVLILLLLPLLWWLGLRQLLRGRV